MGSLATRPDAGGSGRAPLAEIAAQAGGDRRHTPRRNATPRFRGCALWPPDSDLGRTNNWLVREPPRWRLGRTPLRGRSLARSFSWTARACPFSHGPRSSLRNRTTVGARRGGEGPESRPGEDERCERPRAARVDSTPACRATYLVGSGRSRTHRRRPFRAPDGQRSAPSCKDSGPSSPFEAIAGSATPPAGNPLDVRRREPPARPWCRLRLRRGDSAGGPGTVIRRCSAPEMAQGLRLRRKCWNRSSKRAALRTRRSSSSRWA